MFEISINNNTDWTDREGIAYLYADKAGASPGYGDVIVTKDFSDMLTSDPADIRNDILLAAAAGGFDKRKVYINKMPAVNGDVRYPMSHCYACQKFTCQQQKQLSKPETRTRLPTC